MKLWVRLKQGEPVGEEIREVTWEPWAFVGSLLSRNRGSWGPMLHEIAGREEPVRRGTPGESCVERMGRFLLLSRR